MYMFVCFFDLEFFLQGGQQCWALWAFLAACTCMLFIDVICLCLLIGQIKMLAGLLKVTSCAISSEQQGPRTSHLLYGRRTTRISYRRHDLKGQGRQVTWSVWAVLAQCCTCVIRGRRGHTVSAEPGGHTSCYIHVIYHPANVTFVLCYCNSDGRLCVSYDVAAPYTHTLNLSSVFLHHVVA